MKPRPDDVGQSLGLPDFVDPTEVVEASFDASQTWGTERAAHDFGRHDVEGDRRGTGAGRSEDRTQGYGSSSSSKARSGFGGPTRARRAKKQLTWAQKAERKQKRAMARREAEAAERDKDPIAFAREIVLAQLTAMPRSRAHLAGALREKEVDEGVIDAVLDRMEDVGLVDDEAYAAMLVRTQVASRGLARRALKQELARRGIDEEVAQVALAQVGDDSERENALSLARKKMATMTRLDEQTQTRRLAGLLARKGYPSSTVWSVIREVRDEVENP